MMFIETRFLWFRVQRFSGSGLKPQPVLADFSPEPLNL